MNNALYKDHPTSHRVLVSNKLRVVYARMDWEGNFVRYVVQRTKAEIKKIQDSYLPAKVGVKDWDETSPEWFRKK
jgi:hypothetical protein